jgi:hypothetical protein
MGTERIVLTSEDLGLQAGEELQWPFCRCRLCGPERCMVKVHPALLEFRSGLCGECWGTRGPVGQGKCGSSSKDEQSDKQQDEKNDKKKDETPKAARGDKPLKRGLVIKPCKGFKSS